MHNEPPKQHPVKCPFCTAEAAIRWPTENIWRCTDCTLYYRLPLPEAETLQQVYEEGWKPRNRNPAIVGATNRALADQYLARLLKKMGRRDLANQQWIDFGAGTGSMSTAIIASGGEAFAVDPFAYPLLSEKGFNAFTTLASLPADASFQGIITLQVIEHLREPWQELQTFYEMLVPHGWLLVSTINVHSLNARLKGPAWSEVVNPHHLYFFTPRSLARMLKQAGFTNIAQLKTPVAYPHHTPIRQKLDFLIQLLSLSGELTFAAQKPSLQQQK